jgi:uncharacterized membrane protein
MIILIIVGGMFALMGLAFIVIGIVFSVNANNRKTHRTGHTTGTVVRISEDDSSLTGRYPTVVMYAPVVEYWVNGQRYEKCNKMYSSPCKYSLGQNVPLLYDPNRPEDMEIEGDTVTNAGVVILVLGIFFILAGAGMLYYILK